MWWIVRLSSKRSQYIWRHRLVVRTPPFHGGNVGSNPAGVTTLVERVKCDNPSIRWTHLCEIPIHTNERNNRCYSRQGQRD